jgi:hypothetical protein
MESGVLEVVLGVLRDFGTKQGGAPASEQVTIAEHFVL